MSLLKMNFLVLMLFSNGVATQYSILDYGFGQSSLPYTAPNGTSLSYTATVSDYHSDIGVCTCDLTLSVCDTNCCCDKDCSASSISLFKGGCLTTQTYVDPTVSDEFCPVTLVGSNAVLGRANGPLCLVYSSSPVKGSYYTETSTYTTASDFYAAYDNVPFPQTLASYDIAQNLLTSVYQAGDPIQIQMLDFLNVSALFSVPTPSATNDCNQFAHARFLLDAASTCASRLSGNTCAFGSIFDIAYYMSGYQVVANPSTPSAVVTPTLGSIYCINSITGLPDVCASGTVYSPVFNAATLICSNIVSKVNFTFIYNSTGPEITGVTVNFVLQSYALSSNTSTASVPMSFATSFQESPLPSVIFQKSGNPGYVTGSPILTLALSNSSKQFTPNPAYRLSLLSDAVSSSGVIQCNDASNLESRVPVTFGQDISSTCSLYYGYSDLTPANCPDVRAKVYRLQTLTAAAVISVGKFGNANYSNLADWIPIINSPPPLLSGASTVTDTVFGTCTNMLTQFNIEVLITPIGLKTNPQYAIVGLQYSYTSGSFVYRCFPNSGCVNQTRFATAYVPNSMSSTTYSSGSTTLPQAFRISSTVTFQVVSEATAPYVPPPVQLITSLPNDIFYPFYLSDDVSSRVKYFSICIGVVLTALTTVLNL